MLMGLNGCINLYRRGELEGVLKGYTFCTDRVMWFSTGIVPGVDSGMILNSGYHFKFIGTSSSFL